MVVTTAERHAKNKRAEHRAQLRQQRQQQDREREREKEKEKEGAAAAGDEAADRADKEEAARLAGTEQSAGAGLAGSVEVVSGREGAGAAGTALTAGPAAGMGLEDAAAAAALGRERPQKRRRRDEGNGQQQEQVQETLQEAPDTQQEVQQQGMGMEVDGATKQQQQQQPQKQQQPQQDGESDQQQQDGDKHSLQVQQRQVDTPAGSGRKRARDGGGTAAGGTGGSGGGKKAEPRILLAPKVGCTLSVGWVGFLPPSGSQVLLLWHSSLPTVQASHVLSGNGGNTPTFPALFDPLPQLSPLPRRPPKALADLVEALVGAVYLDSGGHLGVSERAVAVLLRLQPPPASQEAAVATVAATHVQRAVAMEVEEAR